MWVLALDVGTSSARATGFDAAGRPLSALDGRAAYEPDTGPDGTVELGAERLLEAAAAAIDQCLEGASEPPAAVGASVFWHSLLLLDGSGAPLTSVMTWADTRSAAAARSLRARLDEGAVHARTGAPLHAAFFPAKLTWLRDSRPELFARAATACGFAEYLLLRLTGRLASSLSMASGTGLLDQGLGQWDPAMLDATGITARRLPPIDDGSVRGLEPVWRRRWPALAEAPWLPAVGDGACSNMGSDCAGPERIALNVGTSATLRLVAPVAPIVPWGLWHYRVDTRRHLIGGATSEGGNVWAWARRTLALPEDERALEVALAAGAPDGHGLTALPFLAGERSPGWHEEARAAVAGLGLGTTPADILRALAEAVAYRLGLVYELLAPLASPEHAIVATGGALARSPAWTQMVADVLGVALEMRELAEASSRGAALVALESLGCAPPPPAPSGRVVTPDPRRHELYVAARARQRRLYDNIVGPRFS